MNQVGKLDAGNPHGRFDEWGLETGSRLPRQPSTLLIQNTARYSGVLAQAIFDLCVGL